MRVLDRRERGEGALEDADATGNGISEVEGEDSGRMPSDCVVSACVGSWGEVE